MTYQATIEDATVFMRPWTIEISMDRTEGPLFEVACHEGNYGMFNILSGHRAEEKAAARRTLKHSSGRSTMAAPAGCAGGWLRVP